MMINLPKNAYQLALMVIAKVHGGRDSEGKPNISDWMIVQVLHDMGIRDFDEELMADVFKFMEETPHSVYKEWGPTNKDASQIEVELMDFRCYMKDHIHEEVSRQIQHLQKSESEIIVQIDSLQQSTLKMLYKPKPTKCQQSLADTRQLIEKLELQHTEKEKEFFKPKEMRKSQNVLNGPRKDKQDNEPLPFRNDEREFLQKDTPPPSPSKHSLHHQIPHPLNLTLQNPNRDPPPMISTPNTCSITYFNPQKYHPHLFRSST